MQVELHVNACTVVRRSHGPVANSPQPGSRPWPGGWEPQPYRQSSATGDLATDRSYNERPEILIPVFKILSCASTFPCNFQYIMLVSGIYFWILTKNIC